MDRNLEVTQHLARHLLTTNTVTSGISLRSGEAVGVSAVVRGQVVAVSRSVVGL